MPSATNPNPKVAPTTYEFSFRTVYKNKNTIAQSYLGVVNAVDDASQNITQHYTVNKVVGKKSTVLFADALVPPAAVAPEATTVVPLIGSDAYHRGAWKNREKRRWQKLFDAA